MLCQDYSSERAGSNHRAHSSPFPRLYKPSTPVSQADLFAVPRPHSVRNCLQSQVWNWSSNNTTCLCFILLLLRQGFIPRLACYLPCSPGWLTWKLLEAACLYCSYSRTKDTCKHSQVFMEVSGIRAQICIFAEEALLPTGPFSQPPYINF